MLMPNLISFIFCRGHKVKWRGEGRASKIAAFADWRACRSTEKEQKHLWKIFRKRGLLDFNEESRRSGVSHINLDNGHESLLYRCFRVSGPAFRELDTNRLESQPSSRGCQ